MLGLLSGSLLSSWALLCGQLKSKRAWTGGLGQEMAPEKRRGTRTFYSGRLTSTFFLIGGALLIYECNWNLGYSLALGVTKILATGPWGETEGTSSSSVQTCKAKTTGVTRRSLESWKTAKYEHQLQINLGTQAYPTFCGTHIPPSCPLKSRHQTHLVRGILMDCMATLG